MKFIIPLACLLLAVSCTQTGQVADDPSYANDVQPLFNSSCVGCHGPSQQNGGYRLDSRTEAVAGGSDSVANVVPGQPDSSELHRRLYGGTMPPSGRWDDDRVRTVRNWIEQGAKDN